MRPTNLLLVAAAIALAGCSGEGSADPSTTASTLDPRPTTTAAPATTGSDAAGTTAADASPAGAATTAPATSAPASSVPPTAAPDPAPVPEVGVPGLDSDDRLCSAWSRFAGSFQVVAVYSAFGDDPQRLAALEVAASPVVTAAYADLLAAWPDELAGERNAVADGFLGPFLRRAAVARQALVEAGADTSGLEVIAAAWLAALESRDPTTHEFAVDLPDASAAAVADAVTRFEQRLVPFPVDPSLVTDVEVPDTEAYLASTCPDQGTLSGQEVIGAADDAF